LPEYREGNIFTTNFRTEISANTNVHSPEKIYSICPSSFIVLKYCDS